MRTPGAYPLRVLRGLVPGRNKLSSHISTLSLFLSPSLPPSSLLLNHPVHTTTTTQRHSNGHSNFSPARLLSLSHILPSSLSLALSLFTLRVLWRSVLSWYAVLPTSLAPRLPFPSRDAGGGRRERRRATHSLYTPHPAVVCFLLFFSSSSALFSSPLLLSLSLSRSLSREPLLSFLPLSQKGLRLLAQAASTFARE